MRLGSLFTGTGALDLAALAWSASAPAWHADNDPAAAAVLAWHWPDVPNLGDVTAVDFAAVEPVELITAGWPCQDLSQAGTRVGLGGERSGLWRDVARAVRALRPGWVLLENVPGLRGRGMGQVLGDLAALGFDAEWVCVPASTVGAPHRRERWFCLAWPAPGDPDEQPRAQRRSPTAGETQGRRTWPDLGGPGGTPAAAAYPDRYGRDEGQPQPARVRGRPDAALGGATAGWGIYAAAIHRWEAILGRPAPPPVEPAVRGGHRLSPRFSEWMLGLPDGWVTDVPGVSYTQAHQVLGNGVAPRQAAEALRLLTPAPLEPPEEEVVA